MLLLLTQDLLIYLLQQQPQLLGNPRWAAHSDVTTG